MGSAIIFLNSILKFIFIFLQLNIKLLILYFKFLQNLKQVYFLNLFYNQKYQYEDKTYVIKIQHQKYEEVHFVSGRC